jgi:phage terminase large subunit GpA-like protein
MTQYRLARPRDVRQHAHRIVAPTRGRPSTVAGQYLRNQRGALDMTQAPMMVEPLDQLGGREYQGIVLVGPQRSSKTFGLILGGITYISLADPGDVLVTTITQDKAREFSHSELEPAIRHSPELQSVLSPRAQDDSTFDKWFRSGMVIKIGWPAISQLSSSTYRYVFLTDYDRPLNRDNVDGEGPLWDVAFRRVTTFMSRGKCLAESSPGEDYVDPTWSPSSPHEAPPARGILSLYNNGTRARWYWPCAACNAYFEAKPGFEIFAMPEFDALKETVLTADIEALVEEYARVVCPHCGFIHDQHFKADMNAAGMWIHEGQSVEKGERVGEPRRTNIWSGWLGGCAASFQRWDSIVRNYLQGVLTYVRTSDESSMRLSTTSDSAAPYLPQAVRKHRAPGELVKRAESWPREAVPKGVRFLTAAADVQSSRFVVQVHGWGPGFQQWLIDRYDISGSKRMESFDRHASVSPGAYLEDWSLLLDAVAKTYPVVDLDDFRMPIHFMLVDSGGAEGVTDNAYKFWRNIVMPRGMRYRIQLVKGDGRPSAPRITQTYPDTRARNDRRADARGDVPVWLVNTNIMKDAVAGDLAREVVGSGYLHLPKWLAEDRPETFRELVAEVRTPKGWLNPSGKPNEALDLAVYNRAAAVALGTERMDWDNPPEWAMDPARRVSQETKPIDVANLAAQLNG